MQFIVKRDILLKSLNFVQGVVEKKNTLPILSNVLLQLRNKKLSIVATDLDIIFYDEPTNNLDTYNTSLIMDIINSAVSERKQIIIVSHDSNFIDKLNCLNVYLENGSLINA